MSLPVGQQPKTYFIQRGAAELGPFTVPQLNQMRSRNEISATDLCRLSESTEFHPLVALFPHMADFVRKTPEQHKKEAQTMEGNSQANAALACGVLAWFIAGPVLGAFAVVLGVRSWLRVQRIKALIGVTLGGLAFVASMLQILKPYLQ
jgi:hypothetical protein